MKKNWLTKSLIVIPLLVLMFSMTVCAGTHNEYNGTEYGGTLESIQELRDALSADGYVYLNEGVDPAVIDQLRNDEDFWGRYDIDFNAEEHQYRQELWVNPTDIDTYVNTGNIDNLNENYVIVDEYGIEVGKEVGARESAPTGNDIPDGVPKTHITISCNAPEELYNQYSDIVLTMTNIESGDKYTFNLSPLHSFSTSTSVPIGQYVIESAYIGDGYNIRWNDRWNRDGDGVPFIEGDLVQVNLAVNDMELISDAPDPFEGADKNDPLVKAEMERYYAEQNGETIEEETTETVTEEPVVEEPQKKSGKWLVVLGFVVFGGIAFVVYKWYQKTQHRDDNNF